MMSEDEWVTMTQAAKEIGVTLSKISRLASLKRIKTQYNPYDERTKLVDLNELKRLFKISDDING